MNKGALMSMQVTAGRNGRARRIVFLGMPLLALLYLLLAIAPGARAATTFTWAGKSTATESWSAAVNWEGGTSPSGSVALDFPRLTEPTCATRTPTETCYVGENDLTGLTAESVHVDDGDPYELWGNPISLGAGGLTASPAAGSSGPAGDFLELPISLTEAQKWSVVNHEGGLVGENGVALFGDVTGEHPLTVELSKGPALFMFANIEAGPLTLEGANPNQAAIFNGFAALFGGHLNSGDGQPVTLSHFFLFGFGAVGPLTSVASNLFAVAGGEPLHAATATFDAKSEVEFEVDGPGGAAGFDYSQIASSGNVELGGATVSVHVERPSPNEPCPTVAPGRQYTLVSATGTLSGEFANAPEGAEIPLKFAKSCSQVVEYLKVSYDRTASPRKVVGTVIAGESSSTALSPSSSSPVTNQAVTLTATVGASFGSPSGNVAFTDNGATLPGCGAQQVSWSGAAYTAQCQTSFAASGSPERLSAAFTPQAGVNLTESTSTTVEVTVARGSTTTRLEASTIAPSAGSAVTYTANVLPQNAGSASPGGSVEFLDGGAPIGSCASQPLSAAGVANCQVAYEGQGAHSVTALYLGDANFKGSSSAAQTVTVEVPPPATPANVLPMPPLSDVSLATSNVAVAANKANVKLDCDGLAPCAGMLRLSARQVLKGKRGKRASRTMVTIGTASFTVSPGETRNVAIALNARGRALVKAGHGQLTARLTIEQASNGTQTLVVHLSGKASHHHRRAKK